MAANASTILIELLETAKRGKAREELNLKELHDGQASFEYAPGLDIPALSAEPVNHWSDCLNHYRTAALLTEMQVALRSKLIACLEAALQNAREREALVGNPSTCEDFQPKWFARARDEGAP